MNAANEAAASNLDHLRFLENLDRINRAIQGARDLEEMMRNTLDAVLAIFECDRAFLLYPCDPAADSWSIPMERTRPEFPGVGKLNKQIPMNPEVAEITRLLLAHERVLKTDPQAESKMTAAFTDRFGFKSAMSTALHPKTGKPWAFGLHQCSRARDWTDDEEHLFLEIGHRLSDGLTSLLVMRELRESEAKYRRFVETASEGICALDEQGCITFVNRKISEMLGYSAEELLGKPITRFMFEADIAGHEQSMVTRHQGGVEEYERRYHRKNGEVVWVHVSATPVFDDNGVFRGSFAMATDITQRKQAERTLKLREQEYRTLVEHIPDLVVRYNTDLQRIYVNPAWEKASGLSIDEAVNVPQDKLPRVPNPVIPEYSAALRRALEEGARQAVDFSWVNAKGEMLYLQYVVLPEFDQEGRVVSLLAVGRDITERKQVERELRASEHLFRALVENSPDFIARYDLDYRRIYVNPAIQALFNTPPASVLGHTPKEQSPIKTPQVYLDHLRQAIETAAECIVETPFRTAKGEMHWGQIRFVPEFDADGKVASVLTIGRDIHEIKESEQRLRRFIANLPAFFFTFRRNDNGSYCFPYASPGIRDLYGLDPEDVREDMAPLHSLAHPDDRAHIESSIARSSETQGPFSVEFRICRPGMPERWAEARSIPHEEPDGSLLWYGIMLDITQRKQAEAELARSEEKFSTAFSASPNLMAITRPEDGYIVEINETFCRFFGYTREECVGHNTAELRMWADPAQREIVIRKLAEAGAALYMPVDLRTKSGEIRSVIDSMVFINIENQKYLLSVVTDITELKRAQDRLRENLVDTIRAFSLTVEKRDPYTAGHQTRVSRLCTAIGEELHLDADRIEGIRLAAMIHDIGNVYVPAEILSRPGKLNDLEFAIIRNHAQIGYEIVRDIKFPWPVADMIWQHHERLDGSGYPNGLKAPEILLDARIIAVADVVEAMVSHRPYREALGVVAAMQEIKDNRGSKYDPDVVDACLSLFRDPGFSLD